MKLFGYNFHFHDDPWADAPAWAIELREMLGRTIVFQEINMASLDDVLNEVTNEGTQIGSVKKLIQGLHGQVMDLLSGSALPPAVQQKVDAIFTGAQANSAAITDAINAGTPAAVVAVGTAANPAPSDFTPAVPAPTPATPPAPAA